MAAFNGKWKRTTSDNVDAFIKAIGVTGESEMKVRAAFTGDDVVDEIQTDGKMFSRKTFFNGELKRDLSGQIGQEMERETILGKSMVKVIMDSDTQVTLQQTSGSIKGSAVLNVSGDNMTFKWTMNGVTATRNFVRM